jgi:hypothetical protein
VKVTDKGVEDVKGSKPMPLNERGDIGMIVLNNTDPKLGPLADYSGPTLTMALLTGSPAINGGSTANAPPTDQRGRTAGGRPVVTERGFVATRQAWTPCASNCTPNHTRPSWVG